jgi:hypothetical protein
VLHPHVQHVRWIAGYSAQEAGRARDGYQLREAGVAAFVGYYLLQALIYAEAYGGVSQLSKKGGRKLNLVLICAGENRGRMYQTGSETYAIVEAL